MQQLLLNWLLIGVLLLPAARVGLLQAIVGVPGVFIMLWGGARADRADPRALLVRTYALAPIAPLTLAGAAWLGWVTQPAVVLWGFAMATVIAFSSPAQQAILNRVTGAAVQRGVTAATAIHYLVQMVGLLLAGQMDRLGLVAVLVAQAVFLCLAAVLIARLPASAGSAAGESDRASALGGIVEGLRATYAHDVIFHVLALNFVSSIFNAGAFLTVFPFIIKRIYDGDALVLSTMMVVFFAGAFICNLVLYRFMPFRHPGKAYLLMQLTRILILCLYFLEPSWIVLVVATLSWGLNMGVTTTLARTIVQESAPAEFRARILSVFSLGQIGSAPLGALVLGFLIETFGELNALVPAMVTSLCLFGFGALRTRIWSYRSAQSVSETAG